MNERERQARAIRLASGVSHAIARGDQAAVHGLLSGVDDTALLRDALAALAVHDVLVSDVAASSDDALGEIGLERPATQAAAIDDVFERMLASLA
jgi:hypothetical protein